MGGRDISRSVLGHLSLLAILLLAALVLLFGGSLVRQGVLAARAGEALTLVGFLAAASGLLGLHQGWKRSALFSGLLLVLIGSFGLGSLLMAYGGFGGALGDAANAVVDRFAIPMNLAGPMFFAGIAIMGLARSRSRAMFLQFALAVAAGSVSIMLLASLFEFLVPELRFGSLSHREVHASEIILLVLMALSIASLAAAARDFEQRQGGMFVPQFAFLMVLAISFNLWMFLVEKEQSILVEQTRDHAERLEAAIQERHADRVNALLRMASRLEISSNDLAVTQWTRDANAYLRGYPELVALVVLGPEGIVRWGVNGDSDRFLVGEDFAAATLHRELLEKAMLHEGMVFSSQLVLFTGEQGEMAAASLYKGGRLIGWLVAGIEFHRLFDDLVEHVVREFNVSIFQEGEQVFATDNGQDTSHAALSMSREFTIRDRQWRVVLRPTSRHIEERLPWLPSLMLLAGVIAAGLFGYTLFQLGRTRRAAIELADSERRFRLVAEQTGELVYDCNLQTGDIEWAGAIEEMAGDEISRIRQAGMAEWMERIHPDDVEQASKSIPVGDGEGGRFSRHYRLRISGRYIHVEDEGVVLADADGQPVRVLGAIKDVTQRLEQEEALRYHARHDELTGLLNRSRLIELMRQALRIPGQPVSLLLLDVDRFRPINETLGYETGDRLLKAIAERLEQFTDRRVGGISRITSDRFAIFLVNSSSEQAAEFGRKLLADFSRPFQLDQHQLHVSLTAGVASCPDDADSADSLFQAAELALTHAKARGRNQLLYFDASMRGDAAGNLWIANKLRDALRNREFELHFQPRVNLSTGGITGMEALIRWRRPDGEMISPGRFIPVAEESGMIGPIGWYVVDEAIAAAKSLGCALMKGRRIAINVSARQMMERNFAADLERHILDRGGKPEWFEIELTESLLMEDPDVSRQVTDELHAAGFAIAIDDFGTGYSSLSYLKHLSVDFLKIDQSFVRGLPNGEHDIAIVNTIIAMAHGLQLTLIAEGIEDESQRRFLLDAGCEEGQGFLMARPMPLEDLRKVLMKGELEVV